MYNFFPFGEVVTFVVVYISLKEIFHLYSTLSTCKLFIWVKEKKRPLRFSKCSNSDFQNVADADITGLKSDVMQLVINYFKASGNPCNKLTQVKGRRITCRPVLMALTSW